MKKNSIVLIILVNMFGCNYFNENNLMGKYWHNTESNIVLFFSVNNELYVYRNKELCTLNEIESEDYFMTFHWRLEKDTVIIMAGKRTSSKDIVYFVGDSLVLETVYPIAELGKTLKYRKLDCENIIVNKSSWR